MAVHTLPPPPAVVKVADRFWHTVEDGEGFHWESGRGRASNIMLQRTADAWGYIEYVPKPPD